ncbi:hypothetical protein R1sor_010094 [Riccia sorocarpa]|uniref:Protein kinase domain-containing protein n=1 Tax=Riccia sorocarpa TaxID=122646 RepID=A0ABD3HX07_9MARC
MTTSSRGDKGKAPMVEQEDIGTEEGELLDVHPPLPEPIGRSGSNRKRKKHAREEEGPLAGAVLPATEEEKRAETARKKAEKDENFRQNSIFKHRWFVWFTQETNNQTPLEKRFFTPGSLRGIQNFRSHLMELAIVKFLEEKEKLDARPYETSVSAMSQRLARFLEEVPKKWDKLYDVWLKSRKFESWTEDAVRQKGEKPLLIIPGLTMRNDEEKKKWKRTAELWRNGFSRRSLSKTMLAHRRNTRLANQCLTTEFVLYPRTASRGGMKLHDLVLEVRDVRIEWESLMRSSYQCLELTINEEFRASVTADEWLNIEIFRKHRLQIACTMVAGLKFMHLHKWLHCDIHWQNVLLHFSSWDWDKTKSRADSGRDNENRPLSPFIRRSMVFVGIGDLGWAQSFEEVQKDFDPYLVSDENPRKWIASELNPKLAIADEEGNKFMTKFSQESDIYALGWLIREMCEDFFTDMTDEEKREYNQAVYTRCLHIPNAAEVHGRLLREELEKMTWKKICHPFRNQRRTMDFWAHYFNEQLFIDPVMCARPIEYGPRAKVHPDGPQKVSRG